MVIEAAGVGYRVNATPATLSTLRRGTRIRLITAMIVREDSMTLYGFTDTDARDLFTTLLGVSGVGPKIAMATLAVYDAPALRQALAVGRGTASLVRSQVVEALIGLGFAAKQAEQATDTVLAQDNPGDTGADVSAVLRSALALLGKTR
ncbi:Holliday junction DNA helicase RuvA [Mycobacteroides abscessus subsp. abscessus]|nr:Holliday junction DNA helicase RuvA [Mycobacteroides abscessus subsp. abscessus]